MKDDNLDKLIKDTYIEFGDKMDIHSDVEVPDFNIVINKFHRNLKDKRKSPSMSKRMALTASFTIVVFISIFISSLPKVIAFKFNVIKTFEELRGDTKDIKFSTDDNSKNTLDENNKIDNAGDQIEKIVSLDEARKKVPFKLLVPEYLPDGYRISTVKYIKAIGDYYSVEQNYINNKGQEIQISQSTIYEEAKETISISSQLRTEDININDLDIKLITDDKNFKKLLWFNNNIKFEMTVFYNIIDIEVEKIIKSLK
ncbi:MULTISPECIES: DUF4367 domain-containing protein [Clostridium]|uniref:DUF4367 domain-containing protein n=2 Tax=Clostridium TaxID=1485 RepID=A0A151AMN3_9CLOT|nr:MULTISPECIES: DUF4367 domain-containing protein [Clostridium]KYH28889.1 hypothetical protein CLCOL_16210 [Clostridium colicanis DSM 13634]MBE6043296.1 DUF4367 domain-containing protein [Clostridium thermopalmarium]PRR73718.1 hypothetical protein CPAL_11860 [Clostridium thermopalmarium DSM 5974]PVZ21032.1 uncharacterized protein DUF4367 [Clostridium thermopalmarium DSM 5974]